MSEALHGPCGELSSEDLRKMQSGYVDPFRAPPLKPTERQAVATYLRRKAGALEAGYIHDRAALLRAEADRIERGEHLR